MTSGSRSYRILLETSDRRLTAAVQVFLDPLDWEILLADEGLPAPNERIDVVLVDGVDGSAAELVERVSAWQDRAVVVARLPGSEAAVAVAEAGAVGLALPDEPPELIGVRLSMAARSAAGRERLLLAQEVRKLIRHDLRSPLAVILGLCELLGLGLRGPLTDRQREGVDDIERQAQKVMVLLNQLAERIYGE